MSDQTGSELISVLLPVYNDEKRLAISLDALCSQSYPHKQIIVVDDGSQDQSLSVAKRYQERYPWIEVYHSEVNRGVVRSLKDAYQHVRGEWVYSGSSNDYVKPGFFDRAATLLRKYPNAAFYVGNVALDTGEILSCSESLRQEWVPKEDVVSFAARGGLQFFGQSTIFRKKIYDQICTLHEELKWVSDLFCYFLLAHTHGFAFSQSVDCEINIGGYSSNGKDPIQQKKIFQSMLKLLSNRYHFAENSIQKSGIFSHFGPRMTLEILKNPLSYRFFSKNYLFNISKLIKKKLSR